MILVLSLEGRASLNLHIWEVMGSGGTGQVDSEGLAFKPGRPEAG